MFNPKEKYPITLDGLALVCNVLNKAGHGELISEICDEFEIETLSELTPPQYKFFAKALTRVATGDKKKGKRYYE